MAGSSASLGYAVLPVIPVVKDITKQITGQIAGPFAQAGKAAGSGLAKGVAAGAEEAKQAVRAASKEIERARAAESDAAGRVRVAEAKLAELREAAGVKASVLASAEERLAKSKRDLVNASGRATAAQQALARAEEQAARAAERSGRSWLGRLPTAAAPAFRKTEADAAVAGTRAGTALGERAVSSARLGFGKLAGIGTAAVAGLLGAKAFKAGLDRLVTIENATTSLKTIMGSERDALALMEQIKQAVQGTPFSLDQFATAGKNLVAMNVEAAKVPRILTAVGEAAAASGKGEEGLKQVTDALGKMAAQGNVSLDQVWSISDAGVPALQILANGFGVATDEMKKMISTGTVPAAKAIDVLTKGILEGSNGAAGATKAYAGTMAGLRQTFSGAKGGLQAAVARFGAAGLAPLMPSFTKIMGDTAGSLDALAPRLAAAAQRLADTGVLQRFADQLARLPSLIGRAATKAGELWRSFAGSAQAKSTLAVFHGLVSRLGPEIRDLAPAGLQLAGVLTQVGAAVAVSKWSTLLAVAGALSPVITAVLVPALTELARLIAGHKEIVQGAVFAWLGYRSALTALDFAAVAANVAKTTVALGAQALAWTRNTAAMVANKAVDTAAWVRVMPALIAAWSTAIWAQTTAFAANTGAAVANKAAQAGGWIAAVAVATGAQALALGTATAAWIANTASVVAAKTAQLAVAVGTEAWAAAQWLLNAAMDANPIGLVVLAISALVGGLVYAYTHSEKFRVVVDTALRAVGQAWDWLWNSVLKPGWGYFSEGLSKLGSLLGSWKDMAVEVWRSVVAVFKSGAVQIGHFLQGVQIPDWVPVLGGLGLKGIGDSLVSWGEGKRDGGLVEGPGGPREDRVPILASNGEFVVNAQATSRNLPLLQSINNGQNPDLPRYADGGLVGPDRLAQVADSMVGTPYVRGGHSRAGVDCSGLMAVLANTAVGLDPWATRFFTGNEAAELQKRGFVLGQGPPGTFRIGWRNGGPGGGHSAGTLPDGRNAESGGNHGKVLVGAGAAGADDPYFDQHAYLPLQAMYPDGPAGGGGGSSPFAFASVGSGAGGSLASGAGGGSGGGSAQTQIARAQQAETRASEQVAKANDRESDATSRLAVAKQRLAEVEADPKSKESAKMAARDRVEKAQRDVDEAKDAKKRAEDKLGQTRAAREELEANPPPDNAKKDKGQGKASEGPGGEDFGKSLGKGLLQMVGLDGSILDSPMEWGGVKWLMGAINSFTKPAGGQPGAGAALSVGQGVGADALPGLGGGGGFSLPGVDPGSLPGLPGLSPQAPAAPQLGADGATGTPDVTASLAQSPDPAGQGAGGAGPTTVDQRVQFNGPVGADAGAVAQQVQSGFNSRNRAVNLTVGRQT